MPWSYYSSISIFGKNPSISTSHIFAQLTQANEKMSHKPSVSQTILTKVLKKSKTLIVLFLKHFTKKAHCRRSNWCVTLRPWNFMNYGCVCQIVTQKRLEYRKRSKKCFDRKNLLFISICVLKHGQQWNSTARLLRIACSTLERQMTKYLQIICLVPVKK